MARLAEIKNTVIDISAGSGLGILGGYVSAFNIAIGIIAATLGALLVATRLIMAWEERKNTTKREARAKEIHDLEVKELKLRLKKAEEK